MATPELSVVVTTHQQAAFLRDALTSLTRQFADPSRLEVIVVDDASSDDPGAVVADFVGLLPSLRLITLPAQLGVSAAREAGLEAASGRTLTVLDGDDWYAPGHLEAMLGHLDGLGVDFVKCDVIPENNGNRSVRHAPQARRDVRLDPRESILPVDAMSMVDFPFVWAALYRRELRDSGVLRFDTDLRTAEDRLCTWRLHLGATSYAVVDAPGILYRRGVASSLTSIGDERQLDFGPAYRRIFELVGQDRESERFLPKALRQFLAIAHHHVARRKQLNPVTAAGLGPAIALAVESVSRDDLEASLALLDRRRRRALQPYLVDSLRSLPAKAVSA